MTTAHRGSSISLDQGIQLAVSQEGGLSCPHRRPQPWSLGRERQRDPAISLQPPNTPRHTNTRRFLQALTHARTHTQRHSGQGSGWGQAELGGCRCEASGRLFLGEGLVKGTK